MNVAPAVQTIRTEDWGVIEYGAAWDRQEAILSEGLAKKRAWNSLAEQERVGTLSITNHLVFCSHPHVYTLGKSGHMENLLLADTSLNQLGVSFYKTNRGGDITYHGPGQIVGYPLLDLEQFYTDLGRYMRDLEEVIIKTIAAYGLKGDRLPGATGVWLEPEEPRRARKICAMGVRCSRWLTMHGFALNANTDLSYFNHIVPCGITDKSVTSILRETGQQVNEAVLKQQIVDAFGEVFGATMTQ